MCNDTIFRSKLIFHLAGYQLSAMAGIDFDKQKVLIQCGTPIGRIALFTSGEQ